MSVLIIVGVGLAGAVAYLAECAWWPFAACRWCKGAGKRSRRDGRVWRRCRWCRSSGQRLRVGRRVWNRIRAVHHDAS